MRTSDLGLRDGVIRLVSTTSTARENVRVQKRESLADGEVLVDGLHRSINAGQVPHHLHPLGAGHEGLPLLQRRLVVAVDNDDELITSANNQCKRI